MSRGLARAEGKDFTLTEWLDEVHVLIPSWRADEVRGIKSSARSDGIRGIKSSARSDEVRGIKSSARSDEVRWLNPSRRADEVRVLNPSWRADEVRVSINSAFRLHGNSMHSTLPPIFLGAYIGSGGEYLACISHVRADRNRGGRKI